MMVRLSPLGCNEVAGFVRAVAEWLPLRLAAAAQRDRRLIIGYRKAIPFGVDNRNGTVNDHWPVIAKAYRDGRHRIAPDC
jgi:hypothetical protein